MYKRQPEDIVHAVKHGVDLFDCVMPTRSARFGRAFLIRGDQPYYNLKNARFSKDTNPIDSECGCIACRNYSRAYIHHLIHRDEMLGPVLLSAHNLSQYLDLMKEIRSSIKNGSFQQVHDRIVGLWSL